MKTSSVSFSTAAAAVLAVAIVTASTAAQAPQTDSPQSQTPAAGQPGAPPQNPAGGPPGDRPREFPAPTNLKVLPKNLTGKQVRDIMEGWEGQLGAHCNTCHAPDPKNMGPNGRPRLNFADDSKPEKNAARIMFTMTQKINDDYVSMIDMDHDEPAGENHADHKVTCGTCHRGHVKPEAFIPPPEEHGHPPAPGAQPPR
ncbi:MAG TPA: c-type cytochrome [Terracidiphilus sp.]